MKVPFHAPAPPLPLRRASHSITVSNGMQTLTAQATMNDFASVNSLHRRMSLDSLYSRYQSARRELTESEWRQLTEPTCGLTWVTRPEPNASSAIAVTHVMFSTEERVGELGVLVDEAWQSRGLGTELSRHALSQARLLGLRAVTVMTGRDNGRMIRICRTLGGHLTGTTSHIVDFSLPVD
ncbi:GNAT family N-acetyltransferase [Streptomyces sp. SAI-229]|uniref:GNAT family N-acetyltransferase n=1 Tax=Streptomyces sp. SAI-229 TaxID=3377731 RepID=UPI003C7BECFE